MDWIDVSMICNRGCLTFYLESNAGIRDAEDNSDFNSSKTFAWSAWLEEGFGDKDVSENLTLLTFNICQFSALQWQLLALPRDGGRVLERPRYTFVWRKAWNEPCSSGVHEICWHWLGDGGSWIGSCDLWEGSSDSQLVGSPKQIRRDTSVGLVVSFPCRYNKSSVFSSGENIGKCSFWYL